MGFERVISCKSGIFLWPLPPSFNSSDTALLNSVLFSTVSFHDWEVNALCVIQVVHILNKSCLHCKSDISPSEAKSCPDEQSQRNPSFIPTHLMKNGSAERLKRGGVKTEPTVPLKVSFSVSHFLSGGIYRSASVCLSLSNCAFSMVLLAKKWLWSPLQLQTSAFHHCNG